jgi:serine/threonine protein kinase
MEDWASTATSAIGTPQYIAPEVLNRGTVTKKVDVFAFGLILYEMMTGESVFPKDVTIMQLATQFLDHRRPEIPSTLHPIVRDIIQGCWSDNAEERPDFEDIYCLLESECFPFYEDADLTHLHTFISDVESWEKENEER